MSEPVKKLTATDFNRLLGVCDHPVSMPVWATAEHCPMPHQPFPIRSVRITHNGHVVYLRLSIILLW